MLLSIIDRDWISGTVLLDKHMTYIVHVIVLIYKNKLISCAPDVYIILMHIFVLVWYNTPHFSMKYEQETSFLKRFSPWYSTTKSALQRAKRGTFSLCTTAKIQGLPWSDFMIVINVGRGVKRQPADRTQRTTAQVSGSCLETIVGPNIAFSTNVFQFNP